MSEPAPIGLPWAVLLGFVRLSTHPVGATRSSAGSAGEPARRLGIWGFSRFEAIEPASWYSVYMKTTLDLPDELMRTVKVRAAQEDRKLKDLIAELLERGLAEAAGEPRTVRHRVRLPLVECAHEARPDEEMTPERAARVLLDGEAGAVAEPDS